MEPVVYDFAINDQGTQATLLSGDRALMPLNYYALLAPEWLRRDFHSLPPARRAEMLRFTTACRQGQAMSGAANLLFASLFPHETTGESEEPELRQLLQKNGFDPELHEQIRRDLRAGRLGLSQNRLPPSTIIEDVQPGDVRDASTAVDDRTRRRGEAALRDGRAAVVTLAAGAGSRWTQGAGVVKALHPFCRFQGAYRNFIEVHLAKSQRISRQYGIEVPHVVTTSYLTDEPIRAFLERCQLAGDTRRVHLSRGHSVGLRMIPMPRDLRFAWEEMPQQLLDEQAQKVRASLQAALIHWAESSGGGSDYTDNLPSQCLHPVGHWFEIPNLLRNGTLLRLIDQHPQLEYLMLHNIDTLGADLDPGLLGLHMETESCLTFEVIGRRIEDQGGGLARVDGRVRLVESLAMPREEDEFKLTYYNTMTTWIHIDRLLQAFGLSRADLRDELTVTRSVRRMSQRMPTYITIKDVKKRWGHGQEDVFPVTQFEKLWGDMTGLTDLACQFVLVVRDRGQQLKDPAQLDAWLRDGSAAYVDSLCDWSATLS